MTARADRFPLFDSLRGIAALMVLGSHTAFFAGALGDNSSIRPYVGRLEVAYAIFFVVSAFLLWRPYVQRRAEGKPPLALGAYTWRRFLRIAPAYWVALTVVTIWLGMHDVFSRHGFAPNFFLLKNFRKDTIGTGFPQGWTLWVEICFYAMLPILAWGLKRAAIRQERVFRSEVLLVAALFTIGLIYNAVFAWSGWVPQITYSPQPGFAQLPGYLCELSAGMALAVMSVHLGKGKLPRFLHPLNRFPGIAWGAAAVLYWFSSTRIGLHGSPLQDYTPLQWMVRHVLNALISVCIVLPAVVGEWDRGFVRKILANRVLLYIGMVSYSFYLYHLAWIIQLDRWGFHSVTVGHPYVRWYLAALAGSLVLASLSYHLVEKPAMDLKDRIGPGRRRPVPAEASEQPHAEAAPVGATAVAD